MLVLLAHGQQPEVLQKPALHSGREGPARRAIVQHLEARMQRGRHVHPLRTAIALHPRKTGMIHLFGVNHVRLQPALVRPAFLVVVQTNPITKTLSIARQLCLRVTGILRHRAVPGHARMDHDLRVQQRQG